MAHVTAVMEHDDPDEAPPKFDNDLWAVEDFEWNRKSATTPPQGEVIESPALNPRAERIRRLTYRRSELANIPPPSYLIDGVLNQNVLALLAGKFGTYKSFVSVSWAGSVATGRPWLGHEVLNPGPVIIIAAEGASGMRARIEAWESVYNRGAPVPDDRLIVVGGVINLRNSEDLLALDALCADTKPHMVIWDTLHRCTPGVEENSNTEMGAIINTLNTLRERHDCTQLAVHHTGHAGTRSRGASALEDDFDNSWVIKLGGDNEDRSPRNPRTMEHRKVKDGELCDQMPIQLALCNESASIEMSERSTEPEWKVEQRIKDLAAKCDAANIPCGFGRDKLVAAAIGAGIESASNEVWSRVAKLRKAA